ncbi:Stk1 family PASTA domain-containing Ser/Thr kinase [Gleimia hominis]|uniref:non-specific serine/threonine protein kinase n=1 Tax=Gleimia hominis TaxID=595468 RepID=A0ABU3IET4_9ACTO|nr:Stk1 family PASTA domain-containing Ser/Thr kinase [Gleimia hominis]MDT3767750.1 Stk1 family PASTA domain-containing Ser/Thr kinase [Gleimia hominis]
MYNFAVANGHEETSSRTRPEGVSASEQTQSPNQPDSQPTNPPSAEPAQRPSNKPVAVSEPNTHRPATTNRVTDPLVGMTIDGRYRIERRLARGGMATVYVAHDERLGRPVAVKVMHPHLAESADYVQRFRREARSAARIIHPCVVSVFDQGEVAGSGYLVMELVDGINLRQVLNAQGAISVGRCLDITENVLQALSLAHRVGMAHRDIKPENVLLPPEGPAKVADFGLARAASDVSAATTGTVLGTVAYIAPEVVNEVEVGPRADLYSLGIMMFEMLTGHTPFETLKPIQIALAHVNQDIPAPSTLESWIPSEIDDFVCALAARHAEDRPIDASAALTALQHIREKLPNEILERRAQRAGGPATSQDTNRIAWQSPTMALPATRKSNSKPIRIAKPQPTKKRRKLPLVIATILVLLIAATAALSWWWFEYGPGSYITIPKIAGLTATQGGEELKKLNLKYVREDEFSDTVKKDTIITSQPKPGGRVHKRGVVHLVVSKGVEMVQVPSLVGMKQDETAQALQNARLAPGEVKEEFSESVPKGVVIATNPQSGEVVKHDSAVELVVSKGRKPIEVADVTGKPQADAQKILTDLGLNVTTDSEFSDSVKKGAVISQDPAGGKTRYRADTVKLVVSKGPEVIPVPDVTRLSEADAKAKLEAAGFKVEVDRVASVLDRVIATKPGKGDNAKIGSTVTIRVV